MKIKKYLYLIRCGNSNFYKIGISENIKHRLYGLQTGCPHPLILVYKKHFKKAIKIERLLHKTYWSKQRTRGPWFEFSKDEVDFIQRGLDKISTNYDFGEITLFQTD